LEAFMATTRLIGPLPFDFADGGLAPGQTVSTVWTINPPPGNGTATFTAVPVGGPGSGDISGPDGVRLAIRDPTIQAEAELGGIKYTLHAVVANVGNNPVFRAKMFISLVDP
jgi:hypothetical protein